ncbi:hypothetical protein ECP03022933_3252 [Escherichia coli P0302293.3]|nr:hypothetical protein ECP03022933_4759 [Escherichia coli P0302293.3]ENE21161.1 hypothetical protein ECP03022933_3252 [Escherichia coli P0302293.3]ENE34859.1 hypothetical protein ECP03022936_3364 [Escherichia coli P0302293.6]
MRNTVCFNPSPLQPHHTCFHFYLLSSEVSHYENHHPWRSHAYSPSASASRLFPFCTGKYRWHGSAEAYTGREVQDIPGVLAVFAERRKDSFGPYVRLMSVTLN